MILTRKEFNTLTNKDVSIKTSSEWFATNAYLYDVVDSIIYDRVGLCPQYQRLFSIPVGGYDHILGREKTLTDTNMYLSSILFKPQHFLITKIGFIAPTNKAYCMAQKILRDAYFQLVLGHKMYAEGPCLTTLTIGELQQKARVTWEGATEEYPVGADVDIYPNDAKLCFTNSLGGLHIPVDAPFSMTINWPNGKVSKDDFDLDTWAVLVGFNFRGVQ
jgi:hypothetical protein